MLFFSPSLRFSVYVQACRSSKGFRLYWSNKRKANHMWFFDLLKSSLTLKTFSSFRFQPTVAVFAYKLG